MAETMFWGLKEKMTVSGADLSENDLNLQLFIGIQRALLRADEDQLNYRLLKFIYPNWNTLQNGDRMEFVSNLAGVKKAIAGHLKHPLGKYFFKLCNRYNTIFLLIGDIIEQKLPADEFEHVFSDAEELRSPIKKVYKKRYAKERSRLNRLAFLSVLSIFLSKIVVALGVEVPIDLYLTHEYSLFNTIVNVVFPAVLMLIIVLSIKMPSEENEKLVVDITKNIGYGDDKKGFSIIVPKKKNLLTRLIIHTLYLGLFLFVFYFLYKRLKEFGFSDANIAIFTFFTSLVAATGVKVHNRAKDISLEEKNPKISGFLIDIFALPFITVGKWGLATLNRLNILVVVFNLIIELPFQIFIQLVENFRSFIKSKKEEIS